MKYYITAVHGGVRIVKESDSRQTLWVSKTMPNSEARTEILKLQLEDLQRKQEKQAQRRVHHRSH